MAQKQATVELTYLEYIILSGSDRRWRFKTKPNPPFDQLIYNLITVHLFQMRVVYFTLSSGDYSKQHAYEIHDDGMWFLAHLFTNWEEMKDKAEVHTSRTYQGLPRCNRCGQDCMTECVHCRKPFCETCYDLHQFDLRQQQQTHQTFNFRFGNVGDADYITIEDFLGRVHQTRYTHTFTQAQTIPAEVRDAHKVLGISSEKPTEEEIRAAFRTRAKAIHPDTGGRGGDMDKLTQAKERALKFAGVK